MIDGNDIVELLTALVVAFNAYETRRVHRVVNSRATAQDARIEQLTASLTTSDTAVPPTVPPNPEVAPQPDLGEFDA